MTARTVAGGPSVLAVLAATATALAGCGGARPAAIPGVVQVVAGENFWGNIAGQTGGHVRVTSILTSPAADPRSAYSAGRCHESQRRLSRPAIARWTGRGRERGLVGF